MCSRSPNILLLLQFSLNSSGRLLLAPLTAQWHSRLEERSPFLLFFSPAIIQNGKNKDFKNISLYFWLFYRYRCHYPIFRENVFYVTFMSISTLKNKKQKPWYLCLVLQRTSDFWLIFFLLKEKEILMLCMFFFFLKKMQKYIKIMNKSHMLLLIYTFITNKIHTIFCEPLK